MSGSRIAVALIVSMVALGGAAAPALAQDAAPPPTPRVDLYVGVGRTTTSGGGSGFDHHHTGPVVKFGWNFSPRVGLVFDGSFGVTSERQILYSLTAGPRITFASRSRLVPFVQVVAGLSRQRHEPAGVLFFSDTRLWAKVGAGGGLDVLVSRGWAVRVLQVEWRRILDSGAPNEVAISAGVVFRFGAVRHSK